MRTPPSIHISDVGPWDCMNVAQFAHSENRAEASAAIATLTQSSLEKRGTGLELSDGDLSNLDLSGFDLRCASFNRTRLHSTRLDGACLAGASLICAGLERTSFVETDLSGAYLHAVAAHVCDFSRANLEGVIDMTGALFHGCKMEQIRFDKAVLSGTTFYQCRLRRSSMKLIEAKGACFTECQVDDVLFDFAQFDQTTFLKCRMENASFKGAIGQQPSILRPTAISGLRLDGAMLPGLRLSELDGELVCAKGLGAPGLDMSHCNLRGIDFSGADLRDARFVGSHVPGANFSSANLTGAALRGTHLDSCDLSNCSAENMSAVECTFRNADLSRIRARAATFRDCDMEAAKFKNAYLYRAMLTGDPVVGMSLRRADFSDAQLTQAYIAADLSEACLANSKLAYVRFNQSLLDRANLSGARPYAATLIKTSMIGAKLTELEPPFFADRCVGLMEAIEAIPDEIGRRRTKRFLNDLAELIQKSHRKST